MRKRNHLFVGLLLTWAVLTVLMLTSQTDSRDSLSTIKRQLDQTVKRLEQFRSQNVQLQDLVSVLKQQQGNEVQKQLIQKLRRPPLKATESDDIQKLRSSLLKATDDSQELMPPLKTTDDIQKLSGEKQLMDHPVNQPGSAGRAQGLTLEHERARRKAENTATQLGYFVNVQMEKLVQESNSSLVNTMVRKFHADLRRYQAVLMDDLKAMRQADGGEDWRLKESLKLGDLVQRRLKYLQNPNGCNGTKMILCSLNKLCGFGCRLHHVTYCLIMAYATQRTLVLESTEFAFSPVRWESVFMPLSDTCTKVSGPSVHWGDDRTEMELAEVISLPSVEALNPRPEYLPLAIPEDLAPRLQTFHGDAPVWWIGQMLRYLMRPSEDMQKVIKSASKMMGFKRPIVGVHIRRTDKIGTEASYHSLDEYMRHVDAYFNQREHQGLIQQRRVYLASDDPTILRDARKRFSNYEFISDNKTLKRVDIASRSSISGLRGIILDMHFLSMTDFLVCTFSSQVCRVAYELMQTMHGDASTRFHSLDDVFYFGGQNAHNVRAVVPHWRTNESELHLEVDDLVELAGNHWDGYSVGRHGKSEQLGLFPSYKVVNEIVSVKMPTYPNVEEE